jgi:hypothetical protein
LIVNALLIEHRLEGFNTVWKVSNLPNGVSQFAIGLIHFDNPTINVIKPITAHVAITPVIGRLVPSLKNPTNPAANAPKLICTAPINAEAVPASFLNGAIESADAFGKLNP